MKERLLVLAKAQPIVSQKYEHLVCVAGITDKGVWRRIYPVPWELFWGRNNPIPKRTWIEYELESDKPSDHRPESRKIKHDTIKVDQQEDMEGVIPLLDNRITSLEDLVKQGHKKVSLGVIKPIIKDFVAEDSGHSQKTKEKSAQQTIAGGSAVHIEVPEKDFSYIFNCDKSCKTNHKIKCEDWELSELFRGCKKYMSEGKYKDLDEVVCKVKDKWFTWMTAKRDPYFIVGTHYHFNTYVIVGVIYPPKKEL